MNVRVYVSLPDGRCFVRDFVLPIVASKGLAIDVKDMEPIIFDRVWCNEEGEVWAFVEHPNMVPDEALARAGFIRDLIADKGTDL